MEDIEKEISEKVIEKSPQLVIHETPQPQPQPVKKPRSEAQKKAFEKARAKRLENLKVKAEEKKVQIAQPEASEIPSAAVPKRRGRPKGSKTKKVMKDLEPEPIPNYPQPIQHQPYEPRYHNIPFAQQNPMPYFNYQPPLPQAPQPVNNYYYYGAPPEKVIDTTQQHLAPQPQPKEEEDEDISSDEEEHEVVLEPSNRVLKYRFA